jgi:hypothetical protein
MSRIYATVKPKRVILLAAFCKCHRQRQKSAIRVLMSQCLEVNSIARCHRILLSSTPKFQLAQQPKKHRAQRPIAGARHGESKLRKDSWVVKQLLRLS